MKYNILTVYVMCPLITRNKRWLLNNITHYIHSVLARETCLSVYRSCVHMCRRNKNCLNRVNYPHAK